MDQDPLAVLANGDGDRLHRGLAVGRPVARVDVEVTRPEAARAVVAMGGAGRGERDVEPAVDAAEGFSTTVVAALTLGSRQLDSISGGQDRPSDRSTSRSGHGTTVPPGTVHARGNGGSYERADLRRRDATTAALMLSDMSSSSLPARRSGCCGPCVLRTVAEHDRGHPSPSRGDWARVWRAENLAAESPEDWYGGNSAPRPPVHGSSRRIHARPLARRSSPSA
jgi:hypothetical protein